MVIWFAFAAPWKTRVMFTCDACPTESLFKGTRHDKKTGTLQWVISSFKKVLVLLNVWSFKDNTAPWEHQALLKCSLLFCLSISRGRFGLGGGRPTCVRSNKRAPSRTIDSGSWWPKLHSVATKKSDCCSSRIIGCSNPEGNSDKGGGLSPP